MKKVAIYARVSSEAQQKERTIESQIAELKKQVAKNAGTLEKEYIDDGHSGALLDRPAMNELRDDLKTNKFDAIYFLAADRIARDVTYQNIIVGEILRHKKQIYIGGKDFVNNPENKFTLTVLGAVSELERAKIIERCTRGRKHWLKQGVLMSNGKDTYGYRYHRRTQTSFPKYTVNQQEAEVVKQIYEMYAKGDVSYRQITKHLAKTKAYRRPGSKAWNWSHVHSILNNEMYTGIRYFDSMTYADDDQDPMHKKKATKMVYRDRKDWIGIKVPSIISKELYETVQRRVQHNKACFRNAKGKQLLSGLIWCGRCDSRCFSFRQYYWIKRSKSLRIYEKYLYTCAGRRKVGKCDTTQIDVRPLEHCVFEMIREAMLDPIKLRACMPGLKQNGAASKRKIEKQVQGIDQKIKETSLKKSRIVDLYASGDLNKEEYLKRIAMYDTDASLFSAKRVELLNRVPVMHKPEAITAAIGNFCENAKQQYEALSDFDSKRRFILDFIEKVTYRNDRVTVHGSIPIESNKIEFEIKRMIDREQLRDQLLEHDRKTGVCGSPITRSRFGHMVNDGAKVLSRQSI